MIVDLYSLFISAIIVAFIFIFAERIAMFIHRTSTSPIKKRINEDSYVRIWHYGKYAVLFGYIITAAYFLVAV